MKTLAISFLFFTSFSYTQNELWPISNAEWYFGITDNSTFEGYSHIKIDRDTLINGLFCQVYSFEKHSYLSGIPGGLNMDFLDNSFAILSLTDSVLLLYDEPSNLFDTIIDFNATVGSSWNSWIRDTACFGNGDSYLTTVTNKTTETINGRILQKFTLNRLDQNGNSHTVIVYQQIAGNFNFLFNVECKSIDQGVTSTLRCFFMDQGSPTAFDYQVGANACDDYPKVSLDEKGGEKDGFSLYPNPNEGSFVIKGINDSEIEQVSILDIQGKSMSFKVIKINETTSQIDFTSAKRGMYIVQIWNVSGEKQNIRIMKN